MRVQGIRNGKISESREAAVAGHRGFVRGFRSALHARATPAPRPRHARQMLLARTHILAGGPREAASAKALHQHGFPWSGDATQTPCGVATELSLSLFLMTMRVPPLLWSLLHHWLSPRAINFAAEALLLHCIHHRGLRLRVRLQRETNGGRVHPARDPTWRSMHSRSTRAKNLIRQ